MRYMNTLPWALVWFVTTCVGVVPRESVGQTICPNNRSALRIWLLQTPLDCKKSQETLDASTDAFDIYNDYGETWDTSANQVQAFLTDSPTTTLNSVINDMANQGLVFVNTHGITIYDANNDPIERGIPIFEFYLTEPAMLNAIDGYVNPPNTTWLAGELIPGTIYMSDGTTVASRGIGVRSTALQRNYRVSPGDGLIFAGWSHSLAKSDDFLGASYIGNGVDCSALCSRTDYTYRETWKNFGCLGAEIDRQAVKDAIPKDLIPALDCTGYTKNGDWRMSCNIGCDDPVAIFRDVGAFDDVAWAIVDHVGTRAIRLYGFESQRASPDDGKLLREIIPAPDGEQRFHSVQGIEPTFPYMAWCEFDKSGKRSWSTMFGRTERPAYWEELKNLNKTGRHSDRATHEPGSWREVEIDENGKLVTVERVPRKSVGTFEVESNPFPGADIGIGYYQDDLGPALVERATIEQLHPSWAIRMFEFSGGGGTIPTWAQNIWADALIQANKDYNGWCDQNPGECMRTFPEDPVFGLVGTIAPPAQRLDFDTFPDEFNRCSGGAVLGPCSDVSAGGDVIVGTSPLEDLPMYFVPAANQSEAERLLDSASRYEDPSHPSKNHQRAVFIVGQKTAQGEDLGSAADESLDNLEDFLVPTGIPVHRFYENNYPDAQSREDAFRLVVNGGASIIAGCGGHSGETHWSGGFLVGSWTAANLTTSQSLVVLMPGCGTSDTNDLPITSLIHQGLFASDAGTTIAFGLGHSEGGWDFQHYLWMEILGLEVADAAIGTPWPRIIYDAKYRAVAQYPFLEDYLRSSLSMGTVVTKQPPPTVTSVHEEQRLERVSELAVRAITSANRQPIIELDLPARDHTSIVMYDVRGRMVATIYSAIREAGRGRITWNGRDRSGNLVNSGVYFARLFTQNHGGAKTKVVIVR